MTDAAKPANTSIGRLILVPAVTTLVVTVVRLVGELEHWSKSWFNPEQGGYMAVVGIVWLAPLFGVYFALKLAAAGERPASPGRAISLAVAGCLIFASGFYLFNAGVIKGMTGVIVMWALAAIGAALELPAWPSLFKILAAYGYAARTPVALVMLIATWADWQSHYSTAQPGTSKAETYILFGFIAQLVWWVSFTIVVGSLVGTIAAALTGLKRETQPVA